MIEIELKGYANEKIFERVRATFEFMRKEIHEDIYFNHPCRDFSKTDEALRVRIKRFNGHFEALLTYKGPKIDELSKTRKEIEVNIDNVETYIELLHALGFKEVLTVKKTREKYYIEKGVTITLDEIEGLGKFVEIEKLAKDEKEVEKEVKRLLSILKSLGIERFERKSYLELLMEKLNLSEGS
ncbi:class IV adenylate cyclase [Thermococcus argininiproducens]|uniref:Class IV adenylate cyclase n=1 Tax=Thermococcus argininiproducens TaxID=2866384 RepID=A0A9E7MAD0_9EURY|nr:class IV adenylate cyclase [Thermococcus argininiproducens]USG99990.1 class IV adenylate cyclase [Thermococcus argininiproducens]